MSKWRRHLSEEHPYLDMGKKIKDVIYGGIDGVITTFAVIAGFSGAALVSQDSSVLGVSIVLLFGFANLLADGFSMGVSDFLSSRSEKKFYDKERRKELAHIENDPREEEEITAEILSENGFNAEDIQKIITIYGNNKQYWVDFMMRYELDLSKPEEEHWSGALTTFFSFTFFGFIPLLPYLILENNQFFYACIFGIVSLSFLGYFRAKFSLEKKWLAVLEIVSLGVVAASIAYFVGTFFSI